MNSYARQAYDIAHSHLTRHVGYYATALMVGAYYAGIVILTVLMVSGRLS